MRIDSPLYQDTPHNLTRHSGQGSSSVQNEDMSFFSALVEPQARSVSTAPTAGLMTDALNHLGKSTRGMKQSLKAFNADSNEKARVSYASHLSDTMLMTQMLVKSVGKGAQLIEKISNLQ